MHAKNDYTTAALNYIRDHRSEIACQGAVVVLTWTFAGFLEFLSVEFVAAAVTLVFIFLALHFNWRWTALGCFFGLFGGLSYLAINATYFVASDQSRYRFRNVDANLSYFEFEPNNVLGRWISRRYADKTIRIISCDSQKVAELPRLEYERIFGAGTGFARRIAYRRLPPMELNQYGASFSVGESDSVDVWGDKKSGFFFSFGPSKMESYPLSASLIFTRSMSCIDDSIPLLPLLEVLPWNASKIDSLVRAASQARTFYGNVIERPITPTDLAALRKKTGEAVFDALLDFVTHSIGRTMLTGNLFTMSEAHIIDGMCNIVNANKDLFSGPFAALRDDLYYSLAYKSGANIHRAYPSCAIPQEIANYEFPRPRTPADETLKCITQSNNPLSCGFELKTDANEPSMVRVPEQALFDLLDGEFAHKVVDPDGRLIEVNSYAPLECPRLRNIMEQRKYVSVVRHDAISMLKQPFLCSSEEWQAKFKNNKARVIAATACGVERAGMKAEKTELSDGFLFDYQHKIKCEQQTLDSSMEMMGVFVRFFDSTNKLQEIVDGLRELQDIAGRERTTEIGDAFEQLRAIVDSICESRSGADCLEAFRSGSLNVEQKVEQLSGEVFRNTHLSAIISDGDPAKEDYKALYENLRKINNHIVKVGLCELAAVEQVSKRLGKTRPLICQELGLGRYELIERPQLGYSIERKNIGDPSVSYIGQLR